ncbi:MAG TPA: hypothetical protein VNL14_12780 [Candidatus Acidoferrales bacterium]|nr:hypothetical protein [Candidatus Acidoferrales bacterium]
MAAKKNEILLHELMALAAKNNIEVRKEKLLREVGYRARSGRCRVKGKHLIIVDRDEPLGEQIHFLAEELAAQALDLADLSDHLKKWLTKRRPLVAPSR